MFIKKVLTPLRTVVASQQFQINAISRCYGIYEPDYLESLKPKYPTYDAINFQIKGYDYAILESYQKYLHRVAEAMELEVSDCWATPPQQFHVQRMRPLSSVVEADYKLTIYERTIQIGDVAAPVYPTLLRIAQAALPEGVQLDVSEHLDDHEEIRYVPDKDLLECKKQLDEMGGPAKKK